MKNLILIFVVMFSCIMCKQTKSSQFSIPTLKINGQTNHNIAKAYRIAIGDLTGNIQKHQSGILSESEPCILAGLFYSKPWTRDAAINVWNGGGLLFPNAAKNTLLAQVGEDDNGDKIIIGPNVAPKPAQAYDTRSNTLLFGFLAMK